jgi:cytochrome c-type biogenesis protein CcmH/NrfG
MKADAIGVGIAGIAFGLIAGWVIGSQQTIIRSSAAPAAAAPAAAAPAAPAAPSVDETKAAALRTTAEREPRNAQARAQLGNLYFDAERYSEAITWYDEALKIEPDDADVSTDLGVSYYYTNQPDRALQQFDHSLKVNPKHVKTLLNIGVVRAFGKQDLAGAEQAWQQVLQLSPDSPEGQAARRGLDSLRAAHPGSTAPAPPRPGA